MLVTIRQTQAGPENRFQVEGEGQILFLARTPWVKLSLPLEAERLRELTLTDPRGEELYHTRYRLLDNTVEALTQYKSLFGKSTRLAEYQVADRDGRAVGAFYVQIDGVRTSQMTVVCGRRRYDCYRFARGKVYMMGIFDGERQIAQLTKPLDTWDQLDLYYLHLVDDRRELLPILSFFAIYVDAMQFNRAGRRVKSSVEKQWWYSFDRNDSRYDPQWIARTFGPAAQEELDARLQEQPERPKRGRASSGRLRAIIILAVVAVALTAAVLGGLLFTYTRPKTALTPAEFTQRMEDRGYEVTDLSGQALDRTWEGACEAAKESCQVQFVEAASEEAAQNLFAQVESQMSRQAGESSRQSSLTGVNSRKYTLVSGDSCYMAAQVEDTVVVCTAPRSGEKELKAVLRALGY